MRLGIDAREIENGVFTGIGRSLMHFLRYFDEGLHNDRCILFSTKPLPFKFGTKIYNRVIGPVDTFWWDQVLLPSAIRTEDVEVFFSPYYKIPLLAKCKKISSVLDVMYLTYEPYARKLAWFQKAYYGLVGKRCALMSSRIWTCSEYSKKDIIKVYGIKSRKITIIPLAVSSVFKPLAQGEDLSVVKDSFGISGRYVMYSGNFKPHKNVPALINAFALLAAEYPDMQLVLVAPKKSGYDAVVRQASLLGIAGKVVCTDTVKDENILRALYAQAEVFVMPSLYEGFGIPPLEAMACGTPVVSSNATCLPETCADAALLVEPENAAAYAEAIKRLLTDSVLKDDLRAKGLIRAEVMREYHFSRKLHDFLKSSAGYA